MIIEEFFKVVTESSALSKEDISEKDQFDLKKYYYKMQNKHMSFDLRNYFMYYNLIIGQGTFKTAFFDPKKDNKNPVIIKRYNKERCS